MNDLHAMRHNGEVTPAQKVGFGLVGAGGIATIAWIFHDIWAMVIVLSGIVVVALLLAGYSLLLRALNRRKARPLGQAIVQNSGMPQHEVSDQRTLEDLAKSLKRGIEIHDRAGKDLYSKPWYLLVGLPSSGKTEAIRNSSVGFPPGLNDKLPGGGGTINMDWWFTRDAIILDTAGRYMFQEVQPGTTNEWSFFLESLVKYRPNCPINGLLLVLPADSLIKDADDVIEKNAETMARQLDTIQDKLQIRFPVYVLITKCDLINGFREFFDKIRDPSLQHQILGWSNQAPLDTPFSPQEVDRYLQDVHDRLVRSRLGLLLPSDAEMLPELDQVDALFALPESILKLGPRLQRYLEMVFVAGDWIKPLFFRGIYFTSSKRQGSALDQEVAKILGIPVNELPEGKVWEERRAFFVRDFFLKKVFKERGLVTRVNNTLRLMRQRSVTIMSSLFAGIFILAVFVLWSGRQLNRSIGEPAQFWSDLNSEYHDSRERWLLAQQPTDNLVVFPGLSEDLTIGQQHQALALPQLMALVSSYDGAISVPWIFAPLNFALHDISSERREEAHRAIYSDTVVRPVIDAVRKRLSGELKLDIPVDAPPTSGPGSGLVRWNQNAQGAMVQLLRVETANTGLLAGDHMPILDMGPLLKYVLDDDDKYVKDEQNNVALLNRTFKQLFNPESSSDRVILMRAARSDSKLLDQTVTGFVTYWQTQMNGGDEKLRQILALRDLWNEFSKAEKDLLDFANNLTTPTTSAEYLSKRQEWIRLQGIISGKANDLETRSKSIPDWNHGSSLKQYYQLQNAELLSHAKDQVNELLRQVNLDAVKAIPETETDSSRASIARIINYLSNPDLFRGMKNEENTNWLNALDTDFQIMIDSKPVYRVRAEAYEKVTSVMQERLANNLSVPLMVAMNSPNDWLTGQTKAITDVRTEVEKVSEPSKGACDKGLDHLALPMARRNAINQIQPIGDFETKFRQYNWDPPLPTIARLPLTMSKSPNQATFDGAYLPVVMKRFVDLQSKLKPDGSALDAEQLKLEIAQWKDDILVPYEKKYSDYWFHAATDTHFEDFGSWKEFRESLVAVKPVDVNNALRDTLQKVQTALTELPDEQSNNAQRRQKCAMELAALTSDFDTKCEDANRAWSQIPADPIDAREYLLGLSVDSQRILFQHDNVDYWNKLTTRGIELIARASLDAASATERDFRNQYANKFPLARNGLGELAPPDVDKARGLIRKIIPGNNTAKSVPQLDPLHLSFSNDISQYAAVLNALPSEDQPIECTISVDFDSSVQWTFVWLVQGDKEIGSGQFRGEKPHVDLNKVKIPGEHVSVEFRANPDRKSGPAAESISFDGRWWSMIKALHMNGAAQDPKDHSLWTLHSRLGGAEMTVRLEFDHELPALDQWPQAQKR